MKKQYGTLQDLLFSDLNDKNKRNTFCIISGALLGIITFLTIYGFYPLDVTNDSWLMVPYVEDDLSQHYAGWLYFRSSPWTWPLGFASDLAYPIGSSISFTDSLPFVSIFFKLLSPILPETFQFFGLWVLFSFAMQGISAALLTGLFIKNRAAIILSTAFFTTYPILVERAFRHSALTAQWFILFSFYLYFEQRRENVCFKWQFLLMNFVVVGIHPYFLPITFGFMTLSVIEYAIRNKKLLLPALTFAANLAAALFTCWTVGIFSINTGSYSDVEFGYGYVSMNLNAIFNPLSASDIDWSLFLPTLPQIKGNYDGFNYMGLGVLLSLLIFAVFLIVKKEKIRPVIRHNAWLFGTFIFLCIFAVTNEITLNSKEILTIPIPQKITELASIFRSSGRMFYPVSYLLLLVPFIYFFKRFKKQTAAVLLSALLLIQVVDISPALSLKHEVFEDYSETGVKSAFDNPLWNSLSEDFDFVIFMEKPVSNSRLCAYLAKRGVRTNVNPSTRMDSDAPLKYIAEVEKAITDGSYNRNAFYVFKTQEELWRVSSLMGGHKAAVQYYYYYLLIPLDNGYQFPADYDEYTILAMN